MMSSSLRITSKMPSAYLIARFSRAGCSLRRFFPQEIVQAPGVGPSCEEIEKKEAIQDRRLTVTRHWPGSVGEVPQEVGDRHFTTKNEGHGSCEETEDEQSA